MSPQEASDLVRGTCGSSPFSSLWKTRSRINACVLTVSTRPPLPPQHTPCTGSAGPRSREWSAGLREAGCIWLLHYRPFHWLGCTELMNWGSGQEHIIGRNEFLSQPSQEAAGPGWSQRRPHSWMRGRWGGGWGGRVCRGPFMSQKQNPSWRHDGALGCWISTRGSIHKSAESHFIVIASC